MTFKLAEQLQNDSFFIHDFELCQVRLINDQQFPWVILVPRINGLSEIVAMSDDDQAQLWRESNCISRVMIDVFAPDKMNIAMIGNVVSQLHIHHVARYDDDVAWPKPVWGAVPMSAYSSVKKEQRCQTLKQLLMERSV